MRIKFSDITYVNNVFLKSSDGKCCIYFTYIYFEILWFLFYFSITYHLKTNRTILYMFIPRENCIRFFIIIFLANFQIAFIIILRWWINIRFLPLSFPSHSFLSCLRLPCLLVAANNMTAAVHWLWKPTYRSQPVHHSDPIRVYIPMPKSFAPNPPYFPQK